MSKSNTLFRVQNMVREGTMLRHKVGNIHFYRPVKIPCSSCKNIMDTIDLIGPADRLSLYTTMIRKHASHRGSF